VLGLLARDGFVEIVLRGRKIGSNRQRPAKADDGVIVPALLFTHQTQIVVGVGVLGIPSDELVETDGSLVKPAALGQQNTQTILSTGMTGQYLHGTSKAVLRVAQFALGLARRPQEAPRIRIRRID